MNSGVAVASSVVSMVPAAAFACNKAFLSATAFALTSAANALMASLSFLRRDANVISPAGGRVEVMLGQIRVG